MQPATAVSSSLKALKHDLELYTKNLRFEMGEAQNCYSSPPQRHETKCALTVNDLILRIQEVKREMYRLTTKNGDAVAGPALDSLDYEKDRGIFLSISAATTAEIEGIEFVNQMKANGLKI